MARVTLLAIGDASNFDDVGFVAVAAVDVSVIVAVPVLVVVVTVILLFRCCCSVVAVVVIT